jgi:hypothetical protein
LIVDSDEVKDHFDNYTEIGKYFVPITTIAKETATLKAKNMV